MSAEFIGKGWRFPIEGEKNAAGVGFARADYEDSVRQSILIILSTAKGERLMRPDFGCGLHELVFAINSSATRGMAEFQVREALQNWEPRIDVVDVQAVAGGDRGEQLLIDIDYRVRVTDTRFNLVYPFYLDRPIVS